MSGAGRGLKQSGVHVREVLDLEDTAGYVFCQPCFSLNQQSCFHLLTRVGAVLSETAVHRDAVSFEVLAEQLLSSSAVEALAAKLGVVGNNTVTDLETLDLGSNCGNNTDSLVAWKRPLEKVANN